ncbi:MAG: redoxin domain-containing protein [Bacteroidota bacterium]
MSLTAIYALGGVMLAASWGFILLLRRSTKRDTFHTLGMVLSGLLMLTALAMIGIGVSIDVGSQTGRATAQIAAQEPLSGPAPDFTFQLVGSQEEQRLSDYRGRVVLLNVWATWCAPCLSEMPTLNRLHQEFADQGLVVINISEEANGMLRDFRGQVDMQTVYARVDDERDTPQPIRSGFDVRPRTFLIDREGQLRLSILGERSYAQFAGIVTPYL